MDDRNEKDSAGEVLSHILSDEKLLSSPSFRNKVYTDVPILRRGSEIKSPETPYMIREMKNLAFTSEAQWKTSAWLFYTQGSFMANYEDDYPIPCNFVKYYPVYRDMTVPQLRGYFAWRAAVRRGETPAAPVPFLFMYAYELINCIGTDSPEDSYLRLLKLNADYSASASVFAQCTSTWLTDLAVYYALDPSVIADSPDIAFDTALLTLMDWDSHSDSELYSAVIQLSGYLVEDSLFVAQYPNDFREAVCGSFRRLSDFFHQHRKNSLCEKYFGRPVNTVYHIFSSAVFYDRQPLRSCEYVIDPIHRYSCTNGRWTCEKVYGNRRRNKSLGSFVRSVDLLLRERNSFRYKLKPDNGVTKNEIAVINTVLDELSEQKRRREAARIEIDLTQLGAIRRAADLTRERLLVDEEKTAAVQELSEEAPIAEEEPKADSEPAPFQLDAGELAFLRALFSGGDWSSAAMESGAMPSILADSINEKLFDTFGDTVIDFSSDSPELIDDYTDELKEMLNRF